MTVKVTFSFSYYYSLYTVFAVSVCGGLNTALAAIRIIIGGIIITVVITFIHQLESLSDSNLNFALTI